MFVRRDVVVVGKKSEILQEKYLNSRREVGRGCLVEPPHDSGIYTLNQEGTKETNIHICTCLCMYVCIQFSEAKPPSFKRCFSTRHSSHISNVTSWRKDAYALLQCLSIRSDFNILHDYSIQINTTEHARAKERTCQFEVQVSCQRNNR